MSEAPVVIIGAGLAGLVAARLLEQQGIDGCVMLEARGAPGGRIASFGPAAFDLGPTWFWPEQQPELDRLVHELQLQRFAQQETGDMLFEREGANRPLRLEGQPAWVPSMRIVGGMRALIDKLLGDLRTTRVETGQKARRVRLSGPAVEVDAEDDAGAMSTWRGSQVFLALPPRLCAQSLAFLPDLPSELSGQLRRTPTWMAPHAKYLAVYDRPFWREQGLSGEARSARGPLGEIHDASAPGSQSALFGFFAVPAQVRAGVPMSTMLAHCQAQLVRLFGQEAATPRMEAIKDWASDPLTATATDLQGSANHAAAPPAQAATGPWRDRLTGVASEWSPTFPGYLAGAVEAARLGVEQFMQRQAPTRSGDGAPCCA